MSQTPALFGEVESGCPVCGAVESCSSYHLAESAFTTDPKVPMPTHPKPGVIAKTRIWEHNRLVYAPGDAVPYDQAVKFGLIKVETVEAVKQVEAEAAQAGSPEGTAEKRAGVREKRALANRERRAGEDRSA